MGLILVVNRGNCRPNPARAGGLSPAPAQHRAVAIEREASKEWPPPALGRRCAHRSDLSAECIRCAWDTSRSFILCLRLIRRSSGSIDWNSRDHEQRRARARATGSTVTSAASSVLPAGSDVQSLRVSLAPRSSTTTSLSMRPLRRWCSQRFCSRNLARPRP